MRLEPAVLAWADAGASPRGVWGVAFSGGADSLALLLLLWAHWPKRRRALRALHFDHRLRGAESRGDAAFCRKVCRALGVTLVEGSWTAAARRTGSARNARGVRGVCVPRDASGNVSGKISEAEARAARMAFFDKHARVVWLGHQQDDIAETMLMRLARGSGAGGLSAPRPVQRFANGRVRLRPLLALKKAEIVAALRAVGIPWREDSTNAGEHFFRNRIRRAVLPAWAEAAERDALAGAARSRELLEEDDAALEKWLDRLSPLGRGGELRLAPLAGQPRAILRRALHRWLLAEPKAGKISRVAFDALLDALERGKPTRHSLGREGFAAIDREALRFEVV